MTLLTKEFGMQKNMRRRRQWKPSNPTCYKHMSVRKAKQSGKSKSRCVDLDRGLRPGNKTLEVIPYVESDFEFEDTKFLHLDLEH